MITQLTDPTHDQQQWLIILQISKNDIFFHNKTGLSFIPELFQTREDAENVAIQKYNPEIGRTLRSWIVIAQDRYRPYGIPIHKQH